MGSNFLRLMLIGVLATAGGVAFAQQATEPSKETAASNATPASSSDSADADAAATAAAIAKANAAAAKGAVAAHGKTMDGKEFVKKAALAGWRLEVRNGETLYCRDEPVVGSRFTKKMCGSQMQIATVLEQQEFERDQLKQRGCGGNCGN
jgi:hypothetical protein